MDFCIIETTNGAFEVIATGLSFVDSTNQAMTLEFNLGGRFLAVAEEHSTPAAYAAWRDEGKRNYDPTQGGWAFL